MSAYNPNLLGKILDRAGHPATPGPEALIAIRKANSLCAKHGKTLGDVAQFVDGDIFLEARHMPHADLLAEIADTTLARDHAEARLAEQAQTIADLERLRAEDSSAIQALQAEVVRLTEKLDTQPVVCSIQSASNMVSCDPLTIDGSRIETPPAALPVGIVNDCDHHDASAQCEFEPVRVSARCETGSRRDDEAAIGFSQFERARLTLLASLGHSRSAIARIVSKQFGRRVSAASVTEMLRQRWLSPRFRGLVDAAAVARRTFVARHRMVSAV